jgi:hypothetical protein
MKKTHRWAVAMCSIVAVVLLVASSPTGGSAPAHVYDDVKNYFPVQGRLTDSAGTPLDGDYSITFRLYDAYTGGTALCQDANLVKVTNGLFTSEVWGNCQDFIYGTQLYLSIEVEGDGEMEPRQPIYAVPYAWSLRPGAVIKGSVGPEAILHVENDDPSGRAVRAYSMSTTGVNYALVAADKSPDGFGAYIYNNYGGTALKVESNTGAAIMAVGSGRIQSSALSYLWISGNGVRPYHQADSTIIDMDTVGGAKITRGATAGTKNVMLPITITGPLYGQNVTLTGLDIYFQGDTALDGITSVLLRRQTGTCGNSACYATILSSGSDLFCEDSANLTGCVHHWDLTTNNVLTESSGVLYLTIELTYNSAVNWVDIGGVRLTLKHE